MNTIIRHGVYRDRNGDLATIQRTQTGYVIRYANGRTIVTVTEIGWVTVLVRVDVTGDAWAVYPGDLVLLREARP